MHTVKTSINVSSIFFLSVLMKTSDFKQESFSSVTRYSYRKELEPKYFVPNNNAFHFQ